MEASVVASVRRPRVLVVDDDPGVRRVCAVNLGLDGCDVLEARNGQEGFELALSEAPDLLLVDLSMPILDGFGLAAALRQDERTRRLPIVFLTGELHPDTESRAYEAGAVGYFAKPFDPSVVAAFVRGVLAEVGAGRLARPGGHSS